MKKFLILGSLVVMTAVLTGCGGTETLSCTKEDDAATGKTVTTMDATFEGDKTTKVDMNITMELKDQYKSYKDQMVKALETQFASYEGKDGVEVKTSSKDSKVSVDVKVDTTKMKDADAKSLFGFSTESKQSKNDAKKSLEAEGYTCK
ncbi:MAG: YehR family protein [Bacilli bacterium]|nr:YehR family protein [Bacilli bacterium]